MASVQDYAKLSMAVYKDNGLPQGWGILEPDSESSGFYAIAYRNLTSGEVVIAYRGTEFLSDAGDLAAAEAILKEAAGFDAMHQQFIDGLEFARRVHDQFEAQAPSITVTGHSLGGTLAQLAADVFGWDGVTFDAPGAKNLTDNTGFTPWLTRYQHSFGHAGALTNYTVVGSAISSGTGPSIGTETSVDTGAGLGALPVIGAIGIGPAAAIAIAAGAIDQYQRHAIANIYSYLQAQSKAGHLLQEHVYRYLEHGIEDYSPRGWSAASVLGDFFHDFVAGVPALTQGDAEALIGNVESLKTLAYFTDPENLSAREDLIRAEDELRRGAQDISAVSLSTAHWSERSGPDQVLTVTIDLEHPLELESQVLRLDLPATDGVSGKPLYYTVSGDGLTPVMADGTDALGFTGVDHYELYVAPGQGSASVRLTAIDDGNGQDDKLNLGSLKVSLPRREPSATTLVEVPLAIHEDLPPALVPVSDVVLGTPADDRAGDLDTDHDPLYGGSAAEELDGFGGADDLYGDGGEDRLFGGTGPDMLYGGGAADLLYGGDGRDALDGGTKDDVLDGGLKDDFLYGNGGNDELVGGEGNDVLCGGLGSDVLQGGVGGDDLLGDATYHALDRDWAVLTDPAAGLHTYDHARGSVNSDTGAADVLFGDAGDDSLWGGGGNDVLFGGQDNDYLQGDSGDDVLDGGGGVDIIFGDNGDDQSLTGNDTLIGGDGADELIGGVGDDVLEGDDGGDTLFGDDHKAQSSTGNDTLLGGGGADKLYGGLGADRLWGGTGDDYLEGDDYASFALLHGDDELHGGEGRDTLFGQGGNDWLSGGTGNDLLYGDQDGIYGLIEGNDYLLGGQGDDTLYGQGSDDVLDGGEGSDVLHGGAGDDWLIGGPGDDYLDGGAGDNLYIVGPGSGHDTIARSYDGQGVLHLNDSTRLQDVSVTASVREQIQSFGFARYYSAPIDVTLTFGGQDAVTLLDGLRGDVKRFELGEGSLDHWGFLDATLNILHGSAADDLLSGSGGDEVLLGEEGADTLAGGAGDDVLDGGAGADRLQGGAGADSLVGGAGADTYRFEAGDGRDVVADFDMTPGEPDIIELGSTVDLRDLVFRFESGSGPTMQYTPSDSVVLWELDRTTPLGVERLQFEGGPSFDLETLKVVWGNATYLLGAPDRNNILQGAASEDVLYGRNGNDFIRGLAGDDIIDGDTGDDYLFGDEGADNISGMDGWDRLHGGAGDDYLYGARGDDELYGDAGDDSLYGGDGDDLFVGGAGNDRLDGGAGADLYVFHAGDGEDLINDYDNTGGGSVDTLQFEAGIAPEMLFFETLQDFYSGHWTDLRITVGSGGDIVTVDNYLLGSAFELDRIQFADGTGFAFTDVQVGSDGVDVLTGTEGGSVLQGGGGDDQLAGATGDDLLSGSAGNDRLDGGAGADYLVGGAGGDELHGDAGEDTLLAGTGNDLLHGGAGADTLRGGTATPGVWTLDRLYGDDGDDRLVGGTKSSLIDGGAGDDILTGGSAWSVLLGEAGDDILTAGAGGYYLDGGAGDDAVTGGAVAEWLVGGSGDDVLAGGGGDDTLKTGTGNDIAYGGDGDDLLQGGAATDGVWTWDSLHGDAGNDTLTAGAKSAMLWGGAGNDMLTGGEAWNAMWGDNGDDTLAGGAGTTFMAGGSGNDIIDGTQGNQWIIGGPGDDRLAGAGGDDHLAGGAGSDTYIFGRGDGQDIVQDLSPDDVGPSMDRIRFGDGIAYDQLWFQQRDGDLRVTVVGSADAVTVQDWYAATDSRLDAFETADGATLLTDQVQQLVTAMAAFDPPPSGQLDLPQSYQTELEPVIAAAWQPAAA